MWRALQCNLQAIHTEYKWEVQPQCFVQCLKLIFCKSVLFLIKLEQVQLAFHKVRHNRLYSSTHCPKAVKSKSYFEPGTNTLYMTCKRMSHTAKESQLLQACSAQKVSSVTFLPARTRSEERTHEWNKRALAESHTCRIHSHLARKGRTCQHHCWRMLL